MARRRKIVFDWYGTLGVTIPRDPAGRMLLRPHAETVLRDLAAGFDLAIWTTAPADYMARAYHQFPFLAKVIGQLVTREVAPVDDRTRITRGVYDRSPRYSKNISLIGGDLLIEDYPGAREEHPEFPVIIVPGLEVAGPEDVARVEAEDRVLLDLVPEIRRLFTGGV